MKKDEYRQRHIDRRKVYRLNPPTRKLREELVMKLIPKHGDSLLCLDAGCGPGIFTQKLLKRNFKVDAFDSSPYAINCLNSAGFPPSKLRTWISDLETFNSDRMYDIILISDVIEHIKEDRKAVENIWRFLNVNGVMIVTVPFDPKLYSECDKTSGHYRRYSKQSLKNVLTFSDGKILKLWCYGFPLLRLLWQVRQYFPIQDKTIGEKTENKRSFAGFIIKAVNWIINRSLFFDRRFLYNSKGVGLVALVKKTKKIKYGAQQNFK